MTSVRTYGVAANPRGLALRGILVAGLFSLLFYPMDTAAQGQVPIIYPSHGQSLEQQSKDEAECRTWAQRQTGFNPSYGVQQTPQSSGPTGQVVRGAAGGAALGAIGGAIGGDAGKGAAVGAGVGAAVGLFGRARQRRHEEQAQQQAVANYNAQVSQYNRAFGGCMSGRGYTVN